jgi:hypothetical protein
VHPELAHGGVVGEHLGGVIGGYSDHVATSPERIRQSRQQQYDASCL